MLSVKVAVAAGQGVEPAEVRVMVTEPAATSAAEGV